MKIISLIIIFFALTSCKTAGPLPNALRTITSEVITISTDNQAFFQTPFYLLDNKSNKLPDRIQYRVYYEDRELQFIQISVISTDEVNHGFNAAINDDGSEFVVVSMDPDLDTYKNERFGIRISLQYLEKMSRKDWNISLQGNSSQAIIVIPSALSKIIFNKVQCFHVNECA